MEAIQMTDIPEFRKAYDQAIVDKKESFIFHGNEVLVTYAKYVLEYADTFSKKK